MKSYQKRDATTTSEIRVPSLLLKLSLRSNYAHDVSKTSEYDFANLRLFLNHMQALLERGTNINVHSRATIKFTPAAFEVIRDSVKRSMHISIQNP